MLGFYFKYDNYQIYIRTNLTSILKKSKHPKKQTKKKRSRLQDRKQKCREKPKESRENIKKELKDYTIIYDII